MKPMSSRPSRHARADHLVDWLGRDVQSANVLATAQQYLALKTLVAETLPPGLQQAFEVLKSDRGTLTLMAANASVAAKLRQMAPRVCNHLQARGRIIHDVQVKVSVQPVAPRYQKPEKTARPLDTNDLKAFEDLQAHLKPGPLAQAVAKLLSHHSADLSTKTKGQDD